MDRSKWIANIKASSKKLLTWGGFALGGVILLAVVVRTGPAAWVHMKNGGSALVEFLSIRELYDIYAQAFKSVQKKVDALRHAEENARLLSIENAKLRFERESAEFECQSRIAEKSTQNFERKLASKTGMPVGRIPESITYRAPENVPPTQLLTLARSYFKQGEDEKAAVLFTTLTSIDVGKFQSAEVHLMAGISWYRIDHLELAHSHFDKVLEKAPLPENLRYQAQARLWKALASAKAGKKIKAQYWLRELVDNHPHSREAEWVNATGAERAPASHKASHEASAESHDSQGTRHSASGHGGAHE